MGSLFDSLSVLYRPFEKFFRVQVGIGIIPFFGYCKFLPPVVDHLRLSPMESQFDLYALLIPKDFLLLKLNCGFCIFFEPLNFLSLELDHPLLVPYGVPI